MKKGFYRTLAWTGIKKNKKLYLPYILTCVGMVMMCYIIAFLASSPSFALVRGGQTVQSFLGMGFGVMCVFSTIFLFYTNSFLIRRRKKEFGLYNILGLGKKNLALVLFLETLIIAFFALAGGLLGGMLFSKLAELGLIKMLGGTADFTMKVSFESIYRTVLLFVVIFSLIYLNTLRQIHLTNPIELLRSENTGEKPPKANWFAAVIGVLILGAAYYLAVTIQDPITAMMLFFAAVAMVIVATYILFISGSVTLCRVLQKNKKYYYKTNHFVSVSSMLYRMKRNGAGLASICILCTMVLVMVSSTVCLFTGVEGSLRNRYPRNINLNADVSDADMLDSDLSDQVIGLAVSAAREGGAEPENVLCYRMADFGGILTEDRISLDDPVYSGTHAGIADLWQVFIVPLEDYNSLMGENEELSDGEAIIYTTKETKYEYDTLALGDSEPLKIAKRAEDFADNGVDAMQVMPSMYIFVPNFAEVTAPLEKYTYDGGQQYVSYDWFYGFDLDCSDETQIAVQNRLSESLSAFEESLGDDSYFHLIVEGVASERAYFYGLNGGIFFLGILLGAVFIFAAVLIIYYKQISEGYEDQSRFEIMQKVGMTKKEIKKSINSQILTVFFLPLITAGVHLAFAFPIIRKLMLIFSFTDFPVLVITTCCCYLIFAVFYMLVYKITSRSYFSIVSGARQ